MIDQHVAQLVPFIVKMITRKFLVSQLAVK
jgi:hypothetical protein